MNEYDYGTTDQTDNVGSHTKRKRTLKKGLCAAVAVVIALTAIFTGCGGDTTSARTGYIGNISRETQAEQYFLASMELSGLDAEGELAQWYMDFSPINFSRFAGVPVEHSFSLSIDELYDNFGRPNELMGASGELSLLIDQAAGNALLSFDAGMGGLNFRNNRLFISQDMIALSLPDLYARHEFISVNPQTLLQDWSDSELGMMFPISPEDIAEINEVLPALNAMMELFSGERMGQLMSAYMENVMAMSGEIMTAGDFLDRGDTQITVADVTYNVAQLGYHIPEDILAGFMSDFWAMYRALLTEYMGGFFDVIAQLDPTVSADDIWDEIFSAMEMIRFPHGLTHYAFIDLETGLVRRMDIPNLVMSVDDGWGEVEVNMDISIELRGERRVWDVMYYFITVNAEGEEAEVEMRVYVPDGGPYVFYMIVDSDDGAMTLQMGYDPGRADDNIWLTVDMDTGFEAVEFEIIGSASESGDAFALRDGRITATSDNNQVFAASFAYGLRVASPEEVTIDRSAAVSLFDLNMEQLMGDIMAAAIRFMM